MGELMQLRRAFVHRVKSLLDCELLDEYRRLKFNTTEPISKPTMLWVLIVDNEINARNLNVLHSPTLFERTPHNIIK